MLFRSHVATVVGAAVSAILLSACGGGDSTSAASGKAPAGLLEAGQLSVCTDPEYPPMEYLENGDTANPTGFDSDGARALGKLWDVKVVFQNTSFDGLIPALNGKRLKKNDSTDRNRDVAIAGHH